MMALADLQSALQLEVNLEKDFVSLMGREGFLGLIFEEILQEIAAEANSRLGFLANVNRTSLGFSTETDKGKKQIQTWVDIRGHRSKFEVGLSGGMKTSVQQVVDMAVMTVIGRRTGVTPGWLCLDEVFDGQGRVTKEAALEVLQESAKERLILVIEHDKQLQEVFQKRIEVLFNNGVSSV